MTDTTKPVDLSTLEQGDTVVFRDGQNAIINECNNHGYSDFIVYFFSKSYPRQFSGVYLINGISRYGNTSDIIEIIKNPKRWTDKDMRQAFQCGVSLQRQGQLENDFDNEIPEKWLQQYKERKHEQ